MLSSRAVLLESDLDCVLPFAFTEWVVIMVSCEDVMSDWSFRAGSHGSLLWCLTSCWCRSSKSRNKRPHFLHSAWLVNPNSRQLIDLWVWSRCRYNVYTSMYTRLHAGHGYCSNGKLCFCVLWRRIDYGHENPLSHIVHHHLRFALIYGKLGVLVSPLASLLAPLDLDNLSGCLSARWSCNAYWPLYARKQYSQTNRCDVFWLSNKRATSN